MQASAYFEGLSIYPAVPPTTHYLLNCCSPAPNSPCPHLVSLSCKQQGKLPGFILYLLAKPSG